MGRKPDYMKWLKIVIAKKKNQKLSNRDLQQMFRTSPNVIVQALKLSEGEIKTMIESDLRYVDFEDLENRDITIEEITEEGYGYVATNRNPFPKREYIAAAKNWIENILIAYEPHLSYEGDKAIIQNKKFYTELTSYTMKHWMEKDLVLNNGFHEWKYPKHYVTNGAFIVAMLELGYKARVPRDEFGPNVHFNVNPYGYYYALGQTHILMNEENAEEHGGLREIKNYNAEGLCAHYTCSNLPTHYYTLSLGGKQITDGITGEVLIPFCLKHGAYFEGMKKAQVTLLEKNGN
ncbi:MAG: hypothetical protein ACTSV5_00035 [Promethearchaeota archaeon]